MHSIDLRQREEYITFSLSGPVVPKARPRVTRHGTFMPHRYQPWKALAVEALFDQARAQMLDIPITSAAIQITLLGKHPRRGDLDNISGSVLDALVQSGILQNDNLCVVSSLAITLQYSPQAPTVQIRINPTPARIAA